MFGRAWRAWAERGTARDGGKDRGILLWTRRDESRGTPAHARAHEGTRRALRSPVWAPRPCPGKELAGCPWESGSFKLYADQGESVFSVGDQLKAGHAWKASPRPVVWRKGDGVSPALKFTSSENPHRLLCIRIATEPDRRWTRSVMWSLKSAR